MTVSGPEGDAAKASFSLVAAVHASSWGASHEGIVRRREEGTTFHRREKEQMRHVGVGVEATWRSTVLEPVFGP